MSLESIDMSTPTTQVTGYMFTPDHHLLTDNFIDPDAMQCPDVNFDADSQLDAGSYPATIDADMWAQLGLCDYTTFDETDISDLIAFPPIV